MGGRVSHTGNGNEQHDREIVVCMCGGSSAERWCLLVCGQGIACVTDWAMR